VGIVVILVALILAINLISSTYNIFGLFIGIPKVLVNITEQLKTLIG